MNMSLRCRVRLDIKYQKDIFNQKGIIPKLLVGRLYMNINNGVITIFFS